MIQNPSNSYYMNSVKPSSGALPPEKKAEIKNSINQQAGSNPAIKTAQDSSQDPRILAGTFGIWMLLRNIIKPINKAIGGEYETSLFGKIGRFGDKISSALHLNNIGSSSKPVLDKLKNSRLLKYFSKDFKTSPKNTMAQFMAKGTLGELAQDATQVIEACKNQGIDLSKMFNKTQLDDILKDPVKNVDKLIKGLDKAGVDEFVEFGSKFAKRKVGFRELSNKLRAITKQGAETSLGKTMAKGSLRTMEGLTNGMAGGPWAILMQAYCFANAAKAAFEAPKGEKMSTFMENVAQDLGYYLVGTASLNLVHRAGGNKYRGMTEEAFKQYKNIIKTTNAKAAAGEITKEGVKAAKKQAKELLKGTDLKWWEKPIKKAGKILTSGLDKFEPIIKQTDNTAVKFVKKLGSKLKGFGGGFGRFALVMFVITPMLVKPVVKLSHMIFGRPTKSVLDKEETNNQEGVTPNPNSIPAPAVNAEQYPPGTNYIDLYTGKKDDTSSPLPAAPVNSDQPIAAKDISNNKSTGRTYIPSPVASQFQNTEEYADVISVIKQADELEKNIMKKIK